MNHDGAISISISFLEMSVVFTCKAEDIWNTDTPAESIEGYRREIRMKNISCFSIDIALGFAAVRKLRS